MKILVNAALTTKKEPWFDFYPVFINGKEDINSLEVYEDIISRKDNKTSFINFEKLKTKIKSQPTIVFTIPQNMSGEYAAFKMLNHNEKILIVPGDALIVWPEKVKKILDSTNDFKIISEKMAKLNEKVSLKGLVSNLSSLPKMGRVKSILSFLLSPVGVKVSLKWTNGKWGKDKIGRNGWKLIQPNLHEKKQINFIVADPEDNYFKQILLKIKDHYPESKITIQKMSNAIIAHVGQSFMAFY